MAVDLMNGNMREKDEKAVFVLNASDAKSGYIASFSGTWIKSPVLECTLPQGAKKVVLDTSGLKDWDGTFVAQVYRLSRMCSGRKVELDTSSLPKGAANLLALALAAPVRENEEKRNSAGFLEGIGRTVETAAFATRTGCYFVGAVTVALCRMITGRARFSWRDVFLELYKAGPDALFIVSLIGFLLGVILAFIGSIPLKWFKAELYVASFIGIGLLRLLGATMAGAVMAGRSGAAYSAELGTMKVNEEIDALETMGISPVEYLVLPRFLGMTLMMPFLCIFTNVSGIIGGIFVSTFYLNISVTEFWAKLVETTRVCDLMIGVITSFVFGILIAICGCLRGLRCGRDSEAVGRATTSAMVSSIICMVIATFIITVTSVALGY